MRLRYGAPYWLDDARTDDIASFPRHRRDLSSDVVIIGGGFTGCAAAHTFASAGVDVAVLERTRIGRGSASASTALLMQETDVTLVELRRRYGFARARSIWEISAQSVRDLVTLARTLSCDLQSPQSLKVATDPHHVRQLRREYIARRSAGFPAGWLDGGQLEELTGIVGAAAIAASGNAVVNPYRLTLALAESAATLGAQLFERSPALHVAHDRKGVTVTTPAGTVSARYAVIATGFATPQFKPLMARFKMRTTYAVATERLSARQRARTGDGRTMFVDTDRPYHYFRCTRDGRILFGGTDRPVPKTAAARRAALIESTAALKESLEELFPSALPFRISHAWDGLFATTPDGLPYIGPHRRYPRQLFALGYGGNGMTFGFLAGQVLLRHVLGHPLATDALFRFNRFRARRR